METPGIHIRESFHFMKPSTVTSDARPGIRIRKGAIILLVLIGLAGVVFSYVRRLRKPEHTAFWRGREVARTSGCFNCHGPDGTKGIENPGYQYGEVPPWQGETLMMYLKDSAEIRQYVLNGKPDRQKHPPDGLLHMPAFKGRIQGRDLQDLVVYLKVLAGYIPKQDSLGTRGIEVASKLGCFGCHGPYGLGGSPNPGSLQGYIPGWDGGAFQQLVRDTSELRQWIMNGEIARLKANPVARKFLHHQVIHMPAFKSNIQPQDLQALMHYIEQLRSQLNQWE